MNSSDWYALVCFVGSISSGARWLRVAQREHYLPISTTRFAIRWWKLGVANPALVIVAFAAAALSFWFPPICVITALAVCSGPLGLGLRGRTSTLAWTRRLRVVAIATFFFTAMISLLFQQLGLGPVGCATVALMTPAIIDGVLATLKPVESRLARRYVVQASQTLNRVDPIRIAVTGSYGKTTIKSYIKHLVSGTLSVVASPASFNNSPGLSRAVNEHLAQGTEVFVAEMGTYGRGEIADLVSWIKPSISVLASIGPVHLERFGDLDTIVDSKSEIFSTSRTAIVNIDAYGLASEADRLQVSGIEVLRCSSNDRTADIVVLKDSQRLEVIVSGRLILGGLAVDAAPTNVACAVAVATTLGIPDAIIAQRLATLPTVEHRRQVLVSQSGVTVIDDTYNSNPAGVAAALETLGELDAHRKVVVTPGMVELGHRQVAENRRFGVDASLVADDLVIVGRTNKSALVKGSRDGNARVHFVSRREDAVKWVREHLTAGDAVLYENDLPDHYA
ncbi:MAG TPA: UDP-N-acetylmuramoyl-tripeptide--D-alanyl-D-alanine ligase [Acidimicrobiia bacterium]|nr:UDP-N-acetylmuramoyl-tripeptide--D-alanyl-D-alanine ligase [Acidimicrobiia bacterium]HIL06899.1 UDP-N-acetylmuramoyl-tripeptide--D-alanyl-D-alanine ligase [Acidimicrobiia bacterium]